LVDCERIAEMALSSRRCLYQSNLVNKGIELTDKGFCLMQQTVTP
jgi:hypothetical protein